MDIENKNRVSVEDMRACYAERFPYAPNNQRIGRFAKQIGFRLTKQMVKGQIISFYIKDEISTGVRFPTNSITTGSAFHTQWQR